MQLDQAIYQFGNDTAGSMAGQFIPIFFDTFNDVTISAQISDIQSYIVALSAAISDVQSQAERTYSRVLLNASATSDVQSYLVAMSGMLSDVHSQAAKASS